jgi:5'-methylthioadenosine phosphorylase
MPEAILASELGLCNTPIALVTDSDAEIEAETLATQEEVFRVFAENTERMKQVLLEVVSVLPTDHRCFKELAAMT